MKFALKRENIKKFVSLSFASLLSIGYCHAKWATSFQKLKGLLEKKGEIELNPDALRSIDHPHLYRQHFDFDETLPTSPFPQWKGNTITRRFRRSLQPYRGLYMYNSDRHEVLYPGKHGRAQIWRFTPLYRDCRLILRIQYL